MISFLPCVLSPQSRIPFSVLSTCPNCPIITCLSWLYFVHDTSTCSIDSITWHVTHNTVGCYPILCNVFIRLLCPFLILLNSTCSFLLFPLFLGWQLLHFLKRHMTIVYQWECYFFKHMVLQTLIGQGFLFLSKRFSSIESPIINSRCQYIAPACFFVLFFTNDGFYYLGFKLFSPTGRKKKHSCFKVGYIWTAKYYIILYTVPVH